MRAQTKLFKNEKQTKDAFVLLSLTRLVHLPWSQTAVQMRNGYCICAEHVLTGTCPDSKTRVRYVVRSPPKGTVLQDATGMDKMPKGKGE